MNVTLTRREKILVLIVIYMGLFYFAFQFAMLPMYGAYRDKGIELDTVTQEQRRVKVKIASEEAYIKNNEEQHARLAEITAAYPAYRRNEQIDDVLTGLCVANQLEPIRLSISAAVNVPLLPDVNPENGSETPKEAKNFLVVSAKMVVNGNVNQLRKLLDQVEAIENIRLSRLTFTNAMGQELSEERSISLSFEFIMFIEDEGPIPTES